MTDPLGNPVDLRHPGTRHHPEAQKRDFDGKYRLGDVAALVRRQRDNLALDTGGGPIARLWSTALAGPGRHRLHQGHRQQRGDQPAPDGDQAGGQLRVEDPQWSNAIERNRARTYFQAYAAAAALHFIEKALAEIRAGHTKTWETFKVPDEAVSVGFTEAVRGVLSHHMVIRNGKIANYHPYPPTPWNGSAVTPTGPRDPTRTPSRTPRSSRRTRPRSSRASTSCGRSAASTRACPAGSTCTSATARW